MRSKQPTLVTFARFFLLDCVISLIALVTMFVLMNLSEVLTSLIASPEGRLRLMVMSREGFSLISSTQAFREESSKMSNPSS